MTEDESPGAGPKRVQLNIRVDPELYEEIKRRAFEEKKTVTDLIIEIIQSQLKRPTDPKARRYKELIDKVGIYVPPPSADDETLLRWVSYTLPTVISRYIEVLHDMGEDYEKHAHRVAQLCKEHYPNKWAHIMEYFRTRRLDLMEVFGIKDIEREVSVG
jgi:hypothetical protein